MSMMSNKESTLCKEKTVIKKIYFLFPEADAL
jgi:hypothetical protein